MPKKKIFCNAFLTVRQYLNIDNNFSTPIVVFFGRMCYPACHQMAGGKSMPAYPCQSKEDP